MSKLLLMLTIFTTVIPGCSVRHEHTTRVEHIDTRQQAMLKKRLLEAPTMFLIEITVENSVIKSSRILNKDAVEEAVGTVIYESRGVYDGQLAFIFSGSRLEYGAYYVAEMPSILSEQGDVYGKINGTYIVDAIKRYRSNFSLEGDPPEQFQFWIVIRDGTIVDEEIINPMPWWGKFEFQKPNQQKKLFIMKNKKYPDYFWGGSYAGIKSDGRYEIIMHLSSKETY